MENNFDEVDANPHNTNRVRISITRASFSEEEELGDGPEISRPRADSDSSIDEKEMEELMQKDERNENEQLQNGGGGTEEQNDGYMNGDGRKNSRTSEGDEISKAFENGVTVSEDGNSASERRESVEKNTEESSESRQGKNSEDPPEKSPAMEMIGDRVLIERDGKFELVDVSEIKAEYYDMLGISPDKTNNDVENTESEGTASETTDIRTENNVRDIEDEKPEPRFRPKTTSLHELHRRNEKKRTARTADRTRSQSAKIVRQRNDEYSHIRSEYAMTEQQLEIRRKCREAKLRRQKEEQEREREEQQRKKDDADRAFQVCVPLPCKTCSNIGFLLRLQGHLGILVFLFSSNPFFKVCIFIDTVKRYHPAVSHNFCVHCRPL